jgi:peptidase M15-like protein
MHKRLVTVALGLSLGLATTTASSRTYDFDHNTWSSDDNDRQTSSSARRQPVAYAYRSDGEEGEGMHRRSVTYEHGDTRHTRRSTGGGTSRSCLTPSTRALLDRIEAHFGKMQIISTCRPGAVIAGTGRRSKHASGEAVDFNAGNRKGEVVRWLIANHKSGGTMTYRGMQHIHVDVGYHFVSLNSGGGR